MQQLRRWTVIASTVLAAGVFTTQGMSLMPEFAARGGAAPAAKPDGIKVHGLWKIEVRNANGKLVERRVFRNALTRTGAGVLQNLLSGGGSAGLWKVALGDARPSLGGGLQWDGGPCGTSSEDGRSGVCVLSETGGADGHLTVSAPKTGADIWNVVLSGNITAQDAANIERVATSVGVCGPAVAPDSCTAATADGVLLLAPFTSKKLQAIPVSAGQIVQVTVKLSFS